MGRQAKLKQSRRQKNSAHIERHTPGKNTSSADGTNITHFESTQATPNPNQFVQTMAEQGYRYLETAPSPDIPHPSTEPKP